LAPAALVFTLSYTLFSTFRRLCSYLSDSSNGSLNEVIQQIVNTHTTRM